MTRPRILILGGTGEGFTLADSLASRDDVEVISSLAGATEMPRVPKGQVRRGGFGGIEGLTIYLREERIAAVLDATHPFAAQISANADAAAAIADVPIVHVWRQPWSRQSGDDWTEVETTAEAASILPSAGRVFLTTGRSELSAFGDRDDVAFVARIVQPVERRAEERWPAQLKFVYERGPFRLEQERSMMTKEGITVVVSKNSGGAAASAKLAAARHLGIPVIMIKRPPAPAGPCVDSAVEALAWLQSVIDRGVPSDHVGATAP